MKTKAKSSDSKVAHEDVPVVGTSDTVSIVPEAMKLVMQENSRQLDILMGSANRP